MTARTFFKSTARGAVHYSGIAKMLAYRYSGPGVIFMLHSTVGNSVPYLDGIRCPVAVLERTLCYLRDNGVQFVSLDQALGRLKGLPSAKFCVFTFDDGYADTLIHALPVMTRFAAPFTVYVTTGMMTGEIDAWWLGLAELIRSQDRIELADLNFRFDCPDHPSKRRAYAAIEAMVHANYDRLGAVRAAVTRRGIDCGALAQQEGLTADQLRQLASSPLVTIGAHTERHPNLALEAASDVEREMTAGRRALENMLQREVIHFAYPFGNVRACGEREAQIARAAGFRTAVTTRRGTLFPDHLHDLYALPRESLCDNDTPITLQWKLSGVTRAFDSSFDGPVARM
jgi:peptidoglycan/xylan/chitin deacetylase (PgdA/CDA1 family)